MKGRGGSLSPRWIWSSLWLLSISRPPSRDRASFRIGAAGFPAYFSSFTYEISKFCLLLCPSRLVYLSETWSTTLFKSFLFQLCDCIRSCQTPLMVVKSRSVLVSTMPTILVLSECNSVWREAIASSTVVFTRSSPTLASPSGKSEATAGGQCFHEVGSAWS